MTRSKALLALFALTATMLTSCGPFGANSPVSLSLPAAPSDLKGCFDSLVPRPAGGSLTRQQVVGLVGALKQSELSKSLCGRRLLAWYEAEAAGLRQ